MNPTTQVCLHLFTSDMACQNSFSATESDVVFDSGLEILGVIQGAAVRISPNRRRNTVIWLHSMQEQL